MDDPMLFSRKTLPSGLRVFHQRRRTAMVHATMMIWAGHRHAPADKPELAHLTEHMLDPGIGGYPRGLMQIYAWFAGKGWHEPYLGETFTDYVRADFRVPAPDLDELLSFCDAYFRHSSFSEADLVRHIADVRHERREEQTRSERKSTQDSHIALYGDLRVPTLWPNESDFDEISIVDVRDFHARHYECPNMALVLIGDVSRRDAFAAAERRFGAGRPNFVAPPPPEPLKPRPQKRTVTISRDSKNKPDRTRIWYCWILPVGAYDEVALAQRYIEEEMHRVVREELSANYKTGFEIETDQIHRKACMSIDIDPDRQRTIRRAVNVILRDAHGFAKALPRLKDGLCLNQLHHRDLAPKEILDNAVTDINVFGKPVSFAERERRIRAVSGRKALRSYADLFDPDRALIEVHDET